MSTIILPVQTMTITNTETNIQEQSKIYTLPENLTAEQLNSIINTIGSKA